MNCYPKSPAGLKSGGANLRTNCGRSRPNSANCKRAANKPPSKRLSPMCSNSSGPSEIDRLLEQALGLLPEPIVRRNPTLSNPFVRSKVYELACGDPQGLDLRSSVPLLHDHATEMSSCMNRTIGSRIRFPAMQWFAYHKQVAYLTEQATIAASLSDMLGKIGAVHRATDPPLGKKARAKGSNIAIKGVIEVAEAGGQVLLGLGGQEKGEVTAGSEGLEGMASKVMEE